MVMSIVRFNCVDPQQDGQRNHERYRAMIEMAAHAEAHDFATITLEEHHSTPNGWSPSPLQSAAMIVGATEKIGVIVSALLVPLHHPIRVAEDLAVLDVASGGRVSIVTGLGYRPIEYHLLDKEWTRRGRLLDEALDIMLKAWTGEPFDYKGEQVQVTPVPVTQPHPMVLIGGASPAAAKRAGRRGLPFYPDRQDPDLLALYEAECAEHGHAPFCIMPPEQVAMIQVAEDPDEWWNKVGEHLLHEAVTYSDWQPAGPRSSVRSHARTVEDLRAEGTYQVLSPAECVAKATENPDAVFAHHPLCGGTPPELGWESLRLFTDKVLPELTK